MQIDKLKLLAQLRERVRAQLEALTQSQSAAQTGAVHEEARQEHPKDTRAIEQQYLARGLAERVESTMDTVAALDALDARTFGEDDPIAVGAIVTLEDADGTPSYYFLVPRGGGEALEHGAATIYTITPEAPIGQGLVGASLDDEVTLDLPQGSRRLVVAEVL